MVKFAATLAFVATFGALSAWADFTVRAISLTGTDGLVTLDYFAWDAATHRLWVPAGNTESVMVLEAGSGKVTALKGFASAEFVRGARRGRLGPSSVTIGPGAVFVGNRADSSIYLIDPVTLERGPGLRIAPISAGWAGAPDGIAYVAATKELWITRGAPPIGVPSSDSALTILDATNPRALREKGKVPLGASAEGYAVDGKRGLFYTNLEESGETVSIDVRSHEIVSRWKSGCDAARGLAIDAERGLLLAACSNRVVAMQVDRGGKVVGSIDTGEGLDNIDYSPSQHLVYAAASKNGTLTIARVEDSGALTQLALVPTATGARGVVAGDGAIAYVADPLNGRILIVSPSNSPIQ